MNSICLLAFSLLLAVTCRADPPVTSAIGSTPPAVAKEAVNYTIRVEWKDAKKGKSSLQIVTTEGRFELDTLSGATKINDAEVPNTVKLSGTLTDLDPERARFQLFLGRTVPYVTGSYLGSGGGKSSSYSQLSVGLDCTFIATFGKPLVIQTDDNGTVSILVTRGDK